MRLAVDTLGQLPAAIVTPANKQERAQVRRVSVFERCSAALCAARLRRLARDYERISETLAEMHLVAFAMQMAHRFVTFMAQSA